MDRLDPAELLTVSEGCDRFAAFLAPIMQRRSPGSTVAEIVSVLTVDAFLLASDGAEFFADLAVPA